MGRGPSSARPAGAGPSSDRPGGRPPRPERPPNKATLGSTSYDGAEAEPFEPDWGGASWYGTTSGTYWTLNPKEYADPRKHGPEYQARARRKMAGQGSPDERDLAGSAGTAGSSATAEGQPLGAPPGNGGAAPAETVGASGDAFDRPPPSDRPSTTHTTSAWWEATTGQAARSGTASGRTAGAGATTGSAGAGAWTGPGRGAAADPGAPRWTGTSRGEPTGATRGDVGNAPPARDRAPRLTTDGALEAIRSWLDDDRPGALGRVGRAVVGWAPIALGIGWVGGEISGCGRFAAGCDDTVATSAWIVQIAALVVLVAVARLARIASFATIATLAAAIPAAMLLSATGSSDDAAAGRLALSGLLVIAWVVGLVSGAVREARATGGP